MGLQSPKSHMTCPERQGRCRQVRYPEVVSSADISLANGVTHALRDCWHSSRLINVSVLARLALRKESVVPA